LLFQATETDQNLAAPWDNDGTIWLFNLAMENGYVSHNQMVAIVAAIVSWGWVKTYN